MARMTLTLDERLLARIRARAEAQGTSPSELVHAFLSSYASSDVVHAVAMHAMLSVAAPKKRPAWRQDTEQQPRLRLIS